LALAGRLVAPNQNEIDAVFNKADFKGAGTDARFFGATHTSDAPHVFSSEIELASEDDAASALDFLETDSLKPCPRTCAFQRSKFDVDDVPGARGVHRIATADDIRRMGNPDERPLDSYWIGFTIGPVVYTMDLSGQPGAVSEDRAQKIASAYYDRLTGS
jgi:hypothetical protein